MLPRPHASLCSPPDCELMGVGGRPDPRVPPMATQGRTRGAGAGWRTAQGLVPLPQGQRDSQHHGQPSGLTEARTPAHLCPREVPPGRPRGNENLRGAQEWRGGWPLAVQPGNGGPWSTGHWGLGRGAGGTTWASLRAVRDESRTSHPEDLLRDRRQPEGEPSGGKRDVCAPRAKPAARVGAQGPCSTGRTAQGA